MPVLVFQLPFIAHSSGVLPEAGPVLTVIIAAVSIGVLESTYLTFWALRRRPKYVVTPFVSTGPQTDPNLEVISNLATQGFVERLHQITLLLNMKQVENLSLRNESGLAVFVTSGQEQELVEQIRTLGDVQASGAQVPLGTYLTPLLVFLARTKIRGTVQRRDDRSVLFALEYSQRDGRTVSVSTSVIAEDPAREIDQGVIERAMNTLAIKLIVHLGNNTHLASTEESLGLFLDGLDAAYRRNWQFAISCYRASVQIESTHRGSFGYGYYHLGAALVFQGNIEEGLDNLQIADRHGPPLPETHYMLALALFYLNQDDIQKNSGRMNSIEQNLSIAITLRPSFAEAHHLLGTVYYHRGRLRERAITCAYLDASIGLSRDLDPADDDYGADYSRASRCLRNAIRHYDHAIRSLPKDLIAQATLFDEQSRLVQDRLSATHRLADALRSLRNYSEAAEIYREMMAAWPNIRTTADLIKTYCLAEKWASADQILRHEFVYRDDLVWNKSLNFYRGWALLGGLSDEGILANQLIDWLVGKYQNRNRQTVQTQKSSTDAVTSHNNSGGSVVTQVASSYLSGETQRSQLFSSAVTALDFALHQYPRYLLSWRQTNYLYYFKSARNLLEPNRGSVTWADVCATPMNPNGSRSPVQASFWLAYRTHCLTPQGYSEVSQVASQIAGEDFSRTVWPSPPLASATLDDLKKHWAEYGVLLKTDPEPGRVGEVQKLGDWLRLAQRVYTTWERTSIDIWVHVIRPKHASISFAQQLAIDTFGEIALLLSKILSEAQSFELAEKVCRISTRMLERWLRHGSSDASEVEHSQPLGTKLTRYRLSMLYAWWAYSRLLADDDPATLARTIHLSGTPVQPALEDVQRLIHKSLGAVTSNSLAIYVRALMLIRRGLFRQAIDDLNLLSTAISPYDPHKYLQPSRRSRTAGHLQTDIVEALDLQERITGRRHTDTIVNSATIHASLAEAFLGLDEPQLASSQLLIALSYSSNHDFSAATAMRLGRLFQATNRDQEAEAALREAQHIWCNQPLETLSARARMEPDALFASLVAAAKGRTEHLHTTEHLVADYTAVEFAKRQASGIKACLTVMHPEFRSELSIQCISKYLENIQAASELHSEQETYLELAKIARKYGSPQSIAKELGPLPRRRPEKLFSETMESQLLVSLLGDTFDFLVLRCELLCAHSMALSETAPGSPSATKGSSLALKVARALARGSGFQPRYDHGHSRYYFSRSHMLSLQDFVVRTRGTLAKCVNAQAWVFYREATPRKLRASLGLLKINANNCGADLPQTHFYLTRLYVAMLEYIWQGFTSDQRSGSDLGATTINEFRDILRLAFSHWRRADQLDKGRNLYRQLRLVRIRLEEHREAWSRVFTTSSPPPP